MIDLQPNGEDGELLNNEYANIFYVLVNGVLVTINVRWDSDGRRWRVSDWSLGERCHWNADHRVFRKTTLVV